MTDDAVSRFFGDVSDSARAVDHVFSVLAATYAQAWTRALGEAPINDIKTAWAYHLSDFTHSHDAKRAIIWALQNLPAKVPNSIEFKTLCRQAPAVKVIALPLPPQDPAIVAAIVNGIKAKAPMPRTDFRDWARVILRDREEGRKRTPTVVQMARNALGAQ